MKVIINNNVYRMGKEEYNKLLLVAEKEKGKRIYAVEKDGVAEMKNEKYKTISELNYAIIEYEAKGFKAHWRGI